MKKILALLIVAMLVLAACASPAPAPAPAPAAPDATPEATPAPDTTPDPAPGGMRVALVTDYGTIDDGSFNQGSWEGVVAFAAPRGMAHEYIQPAEVSDAAYIDAIALAIEGGAEIIVTPGFLFAAAIYEAQDLWPDVFFVLIDAQPNLGPGTDARVAQNTVAVLYAEQESGFLAGYAAVMEGHRSLGFMGGIPVPPVVLFGTGFVEGAEFAAQQLGLAPGDITINYTYAMTFSPAPEVQTMAAAWYADGVEIIFAAAGGAGFSVMAAAEAAGALVIGVDIDQAGDSPTVVTSALKGLEASVLNVLEDWEAGNFPGGQVKVFNAALDGVGLSMDTARFQNFTQAQYDAIFGQLAGGEIALSTTLGAEAHLGLDIEIVEIIHIG